ncbi:MAG TPA: hypothetical protein VFX45_03655 [Solirubrobacterales bacterium]|nr:hypothetical protein [Solirubrobacterales bacterium]
MQPPSPARLYAAAAGVILFVLGIVGFFHGASFWLNMLYVTTGSLGVFLAGTAPRGYSLSAGLLLTLLGAWGLALDSGAEILGFLPSSGSDDAVALIAGITGLLAAAGTPRRSEARAQAVG